MVSVDYRVGLPAAEVRERLIAQLGNLFIGRIDGMTFSLQKRRLFMEISGRIMSGEIEQVGLNDTIIHISFRASSFTRFTIVGFFCCGIVLQIFFIPVLIMGIRDGSIARSLSGFIPLVILVIGYLALRTGLWTHPWSEADLLQNLDVVFGDVKRD